MIGAANFAMQLAVIAVALAGIGIIFRPTRGLALRALAAAVILAAAAGIGPAFLR